MDWTEILWPLATIAISGIVTAGLGFALRKGWIDQEAHQHLAAAATLAREEISEKVARARASDSPGGSTITAAERREIVQTLTTKLIRNAKGPVAKWLENKADVFIEGQILRWVREDEDRAMADQTIPSVPGGSLAERTMQGGV